VAVIPMRDKTVVLGFCNVVGKAQAKIWIDQGDIVKRINA
jgi:translation initiation factor IF-1